MMRSAAFAAASASRPSGFRITSPRPTVSGDTNRFLPLARDGRETSGSCPRSRVLSRNPSIQATEFTGGIEHGLNILDRNVLLNVVDLGEDEPA